MTIAILHHNFIEYTQRVAKELSIPTETFTNKKDGAKYELPVHNRKPILFIPLEILCNLPMATSWEDIADACSYNKALRLRICKLIGLTWKDASSLKKKEIKQLLLQDIDVFEDIIKFYKNKQSIPYDYEADELGEFLCIEATENIAEHSPLDLRKYNPITSDNIFTITETICFKYKELIENNGLYELLYDDKNHCKPERAAQFLLYAVADAYCEANDLDLSREVNGGLGALDFKISKGYRTKVCVEVKYSSNDIVKGYNHQLPTYNKAEKSDNSILLVIRNTQNDEEKLKRLFKAQEDAIQKYSNAPKVIIVDARIQASASKRKN